MVLERLRQHGRIATARHGADQAEAHDHHGPAGGFGNGAVRAVPVDSRCFGLAGATGAGKRKVQQLFGIAVEAEPACRDVVPLPLPGLRAGVDEAVGAADEQGHAGEFGIEAHLRHRVAGRDEVPDPAPSAGGHDRARGRDHVRAAEERRRAVAREPFVRARTRDAVGDSDERLCGRDCEHRSQQSDTNCFHEKLPVEEQKKSSPPWRGCLPIFL